MSPRASRPLASWLIEPAIVWALYFALCLLAAFWRGFDAEVGYDPGAPAHNQTLRLDMSAAELTARYGGGEAGKYRGGDLASYLAAGEHLLREGSFEYGFAELWPPGMAFAVAGVLAVFGAGDYPRNMALVAAFWWAVALAFAYFTLRPFERRWLSFPAIGAILLLPSFTTWTFGFGAVMSESLSHAFFLMSLCALVRGLRGPRVRWFAAAGALLGVATLIRAFFDYVGNVTFGLAVLGLGGALVVLIARGARSARGLAGEVKLALLERPGPRSLLVSLFACWLAALVAFTAVCLPWRVYKTARWRSPSLVSTPPGYAFQWAWVPDAGQPSFFKGANAACHVDPQLCEVVERERAALGPRRMQKLALMTFAFRPVQWFRFKLSHTDALWFGRELTDVLREPLLLLEGLVLLALGALGAGWLVREQRRRGLMELRQLAWIAGSFVGWNFFLFTFLQYEWRYSLALRLFSFFLPLLVLGVLRRAAEHE